jgi:hypothetical protein
MKTILLAPAVRTNELVRFIDFADYLLLALGRNAEIRVPSHPV